MIRPLMARYSALQLSAFMMTVGTVGLVVVGAMVFGRTRRPPIAEPGV